MRAKGQWRSTGQLVRGQAERYGDSEAVVADDLRLSFSQLAARVEQAACAFVASGVAHGERIAVWAPNIHEWMVAALGLQSVGAVLVPLNTRFKGAEAGDIIARSGARMLLVVGDFLETDYVGLLREACGGPAGGHPVEGIPSLQEIVMLRGEGEAVVAWQSLLERAAAITPGQIQERVEAVGEDDLSDIMFTSGTTGRPKGVMLTHG